MNIKQIEYIVAIADEKNISKASEKLYISQSALSQTLLSVERELGIPLFIRNQRELIPTKAGLYYIEGARQIIQIKKSVYETLTTLSANQSDHYTIGISSHRGMERFTSAYKQLKDEYPNTTFRIIENDYKTLLRKLKEKSLPLIITAVDSFREISLPSKVLCKEEILLAVPKNEVSQLTLTDDTQVAFPSLKNKPLIVSKPGSTMRTITDTIFEALNITPYVICEMSNINATYRMVSEGLGYAFFTDGLRIDYENVNYFSLSPKIYRNQMVIYHESCQKEEKLMHLIDLL